MRLVAEESVEADRRRALRADGYDVVAIAEVRPPSRESSCDGGSRGPCLVRTTRPSPSCVPNRMRAPASLRCACLVGVARKQCASGAMQQQRSALARAMTSSRRRPRRRMSGRTAVGTISRVQDLGYPSPRRERGHSRSAATPGSARRLDGCQDSESSATRPLRKPSQRDKASSSTRSSPRSARVE